MRRAACALVVVSLAVGAPAYASVPEEDAARSALADAQRERLLAFCASPPRPLLPRHLAVCPLADDVPGCEALVARCAEAQDPTRLAWLARIAEAVAPFVSVVVWLVVAIAILAIAAPLVLALLRRRRGGRDDGGKARAKGPAVATLVETPAEGEIHEADALLAEAEARRAAGDGPAAVALYLRAAVRALDRRGVLRARRTSTNGEYVRACSDATARASLAVIAREADRATFGARRPSDDALLRVADLARGLVRTTTRVVGALLLVGACLAQSACAPPGRRASGGDPSGDDLVLDVLRRAGHEVDRLPGSLGDVKPGDDFVLVVDTHKVALDEEVAARLVRWVEEDGGTLVLAGAPSTWPEPFGAKAAASGLGEVTYLSARADDERAPAGRFLDITGLAWKDSTALAWQGDAVVAALAVRGEGLVVGVTSNDLVVNVGVAQPERAAFLIALLEHAAGEGSRVRVARAEDGIAPPSNPLTALVRAGLGPFVWQGLAAVFVLFLAVGVRHAAPRAPAATARRAFAEHVIATGSLWHRARARGFAVAAYARFVERRLRRGVADGDDPLALAATRAGLSRDDVRARLEAAKARGDDDLPPAAATDAIRDLAALLPPDARA